MSIDLNINNLKLNDNIKITPEEKFEKWNEEKNKLYWKNALKIAAVALLIILGFALTAGVFAATIAFPAIFPLSAGLEIGIGLGGAFLTSLLFTSSVASTAALVVSREFSVPFLPDFRTLKNPKSVDKSFKKIKNSNRPIKSRNFKLYKKWNLISSEELDGRAEGAEGPTNEQIYKFAAKVYREKEKRIQLLQYNKTKITRSIKKLKNLQDSPGLFD